jgi:hypothetical protein
MIRWFRDSPGEGDPDCICSLCQEVIGQEEPEDEGNGSEMAIRLWSTGQGNKCLEARFHQTCYEGLLRLGAFKLSGSGVSGG